MPESEVPIHAVLSRPTGFAQRSGLYPLAEALGAHPCLYEKWWPKVSSISWRLGHALRTWGQRYYRSEWNALVPLWHDAWLRRTIPPGPCIAHFLFAEFAAPRDSGFLRKRGAVVLGTFHASVRRQEQVHGNYPLNNFDWITVVSKTQVPYFLERGFPEERLRVTYHGVDTGFFRHASDRAVSDRLKLLLVGSTERDHAFMAAVCRSLPAGEFDVTILTAREQHAVYEGIPCVRIPGHVADEGLLSAYQQADLLVMPMLDCTANNAILEAMACGTPVMANRVGGIPEYVAEDGNFLMENKNIDDWVDVLQTCRGDRASLVNQRPAVRRWAESFSWPTVAGAFQSLYRDAMRHE